jgi:DNA-binding response OmpR family regulator
MTNPSQHSGARVAVVTRTGGTVSAVRRWLTDEVTSVVHLEDLASLHGTERPDVIVIDRALLGGDAAMRRLRQRWPTVSIVVVHAADAVDVARLLDSGADDAVEVESPVVESRLHAVTRRARTLNAGARIAIGDIVFDRESRRVWCAGREIDLTPTEQAFLDCLFWHAPDVVDADTLIDFVWGEESTPPKQRLVRVYVGYLRTKLASSRQVVIRTIRGVGYAFGLR